MDPERSLELLGLVICLVLTIISSAADAALSAISRHQLHALAADGRTRAQVIYKLLQEPARLKATTLTLNLGSAVAATALMLALVHPWVGWWEPLFALIGLLLLLLIVGEALPKAVATRNPDRTAIMLSHTIQTLGVLLMPFTTLANLVMRPFFGSTEGRLSSALVTEEELKMLVNVGEEEGLIEKEEREMIEGILIFGDTLAREVMVPRIHIVALESDATVSAALDLALAAGHSRIPVYQDTIDNIAGILYVRDLMPLLRDGQLKRSIIDLVRPAYYVPDTMKVDYLLRNLKTRKVHIAIVVDEYGGTAGLVTIEDLLEEIVGEIQDEYDTEEPAVRQIDDHTWIVEARVSVDDLNTETGLQLLTEEVDSLGGLVYERLGSIPQVGDSVDIDNVTISVLSVQGVRPEQLQIVVKEPEAALQAPVAEEVEGG